MFILDTVPLSPKEKRNFLALFGITVIVMLMVIFYWVVPVILTTFKPQKPIFPQITEKEEMGDFKPIQVFNWSGKITSITSKTISIRAEETEGKTKRALITPETKITRLSFVPTLSANGQQKLLPKEKVISISELKTGLSVDALAPTDISESEEFQAVHIRVLP